MKKNNLTILLLIVATLSSSCTDFLSETPDNRTQLDSPDKISELLVNAYPNANYMEFAETRTDNAFDCGDLTKTTLKNSRNYNWEDQDDTDQDTPAFYWDACYKAIAHANQALDAIKKLNDDPKLNPQKGEALIARAYAHFMLVSFWSKRYDPATATTDLGIPYVLEPETVLIKKYTRNTVAEVFDYIQKDLEEGLKYVTSDYKSPKFHFNKAATNAFASRFYLIKGDWAKVISFSNNLGNNPVGQLRDYQGYLALDFVSILKTYAQESETTNLLIASVPSRYLGTVGTNRFQLTGLNRDVIFGTKTNLFNKPWVYNPLTNNSSLTIFMPKYFEYYKFTNSNTGAGISYNAIVLLSNDELFLNRIEAHVMTNQLDLANQELEYYHSIRLKEFNTTTDKVTADKVIDKYPVIDNEYTPFYTLTPVQTSYIKAIAELRRREFLHEGLRWLDIKRFALKIEHTSFNEPVNILSKDDNRKVLQIPLNVSNAGIEKNPR